MINVFSLPLVNYFQKGKHQKKPLQKKLKRLFQKTKLLT